MRFRIKEVEEKLSYAMQNYQDVEREVSLSCVYSLFIFNLIAHVDVSLY